MRSKHPDFLVNLSAIVVLCTAFIACSEVKQDKGKSTVDIWITAADQSVVFQRRSEKFSDSTANGPVIAIDTTQHFQSIQGFGYTLTSGSATLINSLDASTKSKLLQELFGKGDSSVNISYLRISIGASDLSAYVYTYDDHPGDTSLAKFSLEPDKRSGLIPLLKEILSVNPSIKIMGTPWSAPAWMKDNQKSIGGSLRKRYYRTYANYLSTYLLEMKAEGITLDAITPQNEPLHDGNNPSMVMTAAEQADFIKNYLGPAFRNTGLSTKIIIYDHNCDRPDYPLMILKDPQAATFVDGSAFHLYGGDISVLSAVHDSFPAKHLYFTEQYTGTGESFEDNLKWHLKNVIIGSMRNWSRIALEWNLANDTAFGPHTEGGCTTCKGALTISDSVQRNVSYYIIAHVSTFVPPGSVRIGSNNIGDLYSVAFLTPEKKRVLIVLNEGSLPASFSIQEKERTFANKLPAGGVGSYVWQ